MSHEQSERDPVLDSNTGIDGDGVLRYGLWDTIEELGLGGQGTVFKVRKRIAPLTRSDLPEDFSHWLHAASVSTNSTFKKENAEKILDLIREFGKESLAQSFALKVLHEFKDDATRIKALDRLRRETAALTQLRHPSLINIVDSNIDEKWFVMDYHPKTLSNDLDRTKGDLLGSLLAVRPIVEAVALLHNNNLVHRDIKPDNVFVADDGRLVLGDFGLVVRIDDHSSRLTDTYENAGSRDWMPGWAMGMRLEDVRPTFDVFSLGKLLWAVIAGRKKLRLWYHHHPEFELERMFVEDPSIKFARKILDHCVVEHEKDCLKNGNELLNVIDVYVSSLRQFGQIPSHGPMLCRICGLGHYSLVIRDDPDQRALACNYCGNIQSFSKPSERVGWQQMSAGNE